MVATQSCHYNIMQRLTIVVSIVATIVLGFPESPLWISLKSFATHGLLIIRKQDTLACSQKNFQTCVFTNSITNNTIFSWYIPPPDICM